MMKNFTKLVFVFIIVGATSIHTVQSQEFSISGSSNNSISGGVAFDGTNYLVGLTGDATSDSNLSVQFVSTTGQLVGNRIPLGETGSAPVVAFDGTNYLLIWCDRYVAFLDNGDDAGLTNIYGRFINPSGSFVGSRFTIETGAYIKGCSVGDVHFNGTNYFFIYSEDDGMGDVGPRYGRFISTSGTLIGSPLQISSSNVGGADMEFDGTNYLVVFEVGSKYIYGQFISAAGALTGVNFLIDNSENLSDNPVSVAFGGSKYIVAFHDQQAGGSGWNLYAHFVSTSGNVNTNKITICDSTQSPMIPTLAFDGTNYLSAWISLNSKQIKGQFIDTTGAPFNSEYVIFDSLSGVLPLGGVASFSGGKYLAACTKINWAKTGKSDNTNLGIYGKFINESTSTGELPEKDHSFYLYPNPATDIISLNININETMVLNIYNTIGVLVKSETIKQNNQQINISDLSNGIYIVQVKSREWTEKQKLIIQ